MDCLCAIGNAVVGKIAEYTVEPFGRLVGRQVGYLIHYKKNLQNLRTQVNHLSVARDRVKQQVDEADRRGEKIHNDVQKWLDEVAQIIKDTEEFLKGKCQATGAPNEVIKEESQADEEPSEFLKEEHQAKMKCPHQICPNPRLRYRLSRKSTKLVEAVDELYKRKDFSIVSYSVPPQELCVIPTEDYEAFESRISTLNKIMDELRSPSADMILVYGIGGVGKTTLVEELLRQVTKDKLFDDAVMVRGVKIPNLEAIQKEIAEKLGLEVLSNQTISGRANSICERVKNKKTLVILDDVGGEIDLKTLGLPHIPTCKILLTSRTRKPLSSEKIKQKVFLLGVLGENETWLLFEKKAGDVTKDPTIRSIATQVAKKCGGLPVLIVTVARALESTQSSSLPIWKNALRSLDRFDEKEELTEKAYMGLEWSYAQLNEQLSPLFLLCGITIQGNSISLTNLLKYSMGLGFFKDHTMEEARNALYTQVDKLKSSCLLLDGDDNTCVRMHDLVHDVAIRIATRDQHVLVKDGVDQLEEWLDQESFKKYSKISWSCCNIPSLPEVPWKCPELEMFRLHGNGEQNDHHLKIPSNFFEEMPKLKVLDICNLPLMLLPPSLALLKTNLQTLCLDGCTLEDIALVGELGNLETLSFANSKVKELPKEIAKLTHLRLLDLSDCPELEVISPNVISSLTRLEDLRMKNSFSKWEAEGDINKRRNASLSELKDLSQLTALEIYIPDADILPPNLFPNKLETYHISIGGVWWKRMAETTFNTLKLELTLSNQSDQGLRRLMMKSEDLALDVSEGINNSLYQLDNEGFLHLKRLLLQNNVDLSYINDKKVAFPNLTTLSIQECDHLRFLFSCSMAKSFVQLKHLEIRNCKSMEEVVSSTTDYNEENMNDMFCKLETLKLEELPCLGRICTGTRIEFPSLKKLDISHCEKLKAFICDPMSHKSTRLCKEIEERESEESPSVEHESVAERCLFNDKVRFPSLEELIICSLHELRTIWHNNQLADSFCRLKQVDVRGCASLISIFPPSIMGRLNALERLLIFKCDSLKVVFEVGGINVEETRVNRSTPYDQWKPLYCQNLEFLSVRRADSLKNIFKLSVDSCGADSLEIVGEEEGGVELPTPPHFVFPNATRVELECLPHLKSFYPGKHTSTWPLLKILTARLESGVEISIFQDKHESGPVKSIFPIDKVAFPNLTTLSIQECDHLRFLFSCSMAKSFVQLKHLEIRNCKSMEEVVSSTTDYNEENMNDMFCKLETLKLEELPCLGRICTGTRIEFPSLKKLDISHCEKLKAFICDPMSHKSTRLCKEIEERESEESPSVEHESVAERCLFNDKVRFPSLEELIICSLHELRTIWHNNQLADSFCRLKHVDVSFCNSLISVFPPSIMGRLNALEGLEIFECHSLKVVFEVGGINVEETRVNRSTPYDQWKPLYCQNLEFLSVRRADSLKNIFPASLARGLQQLRYLFVENCRDLLEIVGEEEGGVELPTPPHFVFPNATRVELECLPHLKSFYPGKHTSTWPLLKILTVRLKSGVEISIFQDKHESGPVKSIFPIDKDSFPNLEELSVDNNIWYGTSPVPTESFSNLKYIKFYNWAPFSQQATSLFLQKLLNIEIIEVYYAPPEEIFVSKGNSSCKEIQAVGTLPSIRILKFDGCKMLHLGPIFPNLEVLAVTRHSLGLKNLESSAISFRNLTTLIVYDCKGLEHLITYSVAKSLMQLTTMEVGGCPRIAVIVTTDGDDAAEEITFSRLQVLTLWRLPKMQGFCSGSCIVNLPSLTTLSMSNRLKLKIFQEKLKITSKYPDTDVDEEIGVPSAETNIAS